MLAITGFPYFSITAVVSAPIKALAEGNELATAVDTPAAVFFIGLLLLVLVGFGVAVISLLRRMRTSKQLYEFFNNVLLWEDEGYCFLSIKGKKMVLSPSMRLLLQGHAEDWHGLLSRLKDESAAALGKVVDDLLSGERKDAFRKVLLTRKEEGLPEKYLDVIAKMISAQHGRPEGIGIWFKDVTTDAVRLNRLESENRQLKEEQHHLCNLLNSAPFPIWQRDANLKIRYCNLAYTRIVEEEEEPHPDPKADVMELGKYTLQTAKKAKESGKIETERYPIIVEGERKLYEITEVPSAGNSGMTAGFGRDIAEVESLETELRLNIEAQTCLLETSASAMALYGFDTRLKSCNNAFVKLWGLDYQWLESHPTYGEILEACREKRKLPEQSNFPAFKKRHLRLFSDLIEPYNEFFYLPDGTALRVIVIPHALGGLMFAYEDMTDRLAIERSYNTLIAVQRATLDNLYEGVAVFGQNGRVKLFNPTYTTMWGIDASVLETEPHISYILEQTKELYPYGENWVAYKENIITQAMNQRSLNQRLERTDGKVLDWTCVPLPDGAILMMYIDVTDSTLVERSLREKNEALQGADRIKTEFLANVSYELRSPLTTILGFSELLQTQEKDFNKEQREYMRAIYGSSLYLMALINDILDLASIEAGYMSLEVGEFDIYEALQSVVPLVSERIKEKGLHFVIECEPSIGTMAGDDRRIRQCIFKLLSNAIKFTDRDGTVTLGAKKLAEGKVMIWIQDTGIGIAPAEQEIVFEKFYKSGNAGRRNSGTGLGLSVVKSFIALHGGEIVLESDVGKGTCFRCVFERKSETLRYYEAEREKVMS